MWDDHVFFINQPVQECDWWVVYEDLLVPEGAVCPPGHTILITGEPPSVKTYTQPFIGQFGKVVTCHTDLAHPNQVRSQQALPWHVGRHMRDGRNLGFWLDYDGLKSLEPPAKDYLLSVIVSGKAGTAGHRRRLRFTQILSEHFGERLEVFGRGIRDVEDKWDVIAASRYHIVLENSAVRDYWTEKLSDAYLGWAFPIYYGCPNLADYFPDAAFVAIDIQDPKGSIRTIERTVAEGTFESEIDRLRQARGLVLDRYNLFGVLSALCRGGVDGVPQQVTLAPQRTFPSQRSLGDLVKGMWRWLQPCSSA
jgi:hypothetical protein